MDTERMITDDDLYHWGIKGMKWGVRRYQNKDGSLTPAGKKRYNDEMESLKAREKTIKNREQAKARQAKIDAKKAELDAREKALDESKKSKVELDASKPKSVKDMTDEELDRAITRARKEEEYRRLHPEPVAKPKLVDRLVNDVITPAAINSGKKALEGTLDKMVKNALKDKVDPNSLDALKKEYEKLDYKKKIDKLKRGDSDDGNWDDKLKKQTYEKNKRRKELDDLEVELELRKKRKQLKDEDEGDS